MSVLVLAGCGWFVVGWVIARTIFQQHTWFGLIPMSMALGLVLHTALLNALLYVTDTVPAFWGSGLLLLSAAAVLRWFLPVQPLEIGLPRRHFIFAAAVISLIWAGLLPPVLVGEYYDNFHHQALAGVIAHSGNPPMHPFSPPSCSFYHYGVSAMAGGLFSVTHLNLSLIFDLLVLWSAFSLLWLLVFTAYHLLQKPSIVTALLAMGLFLTYASANWLAFPLTLDPIREATQDIGGLDYFRSVADATQEYRFGTLSFTSFTWIYAQVLHMRNNTLGLLCTFLIINLLQQGGFKRTLLIGLLLGIMPLFDETAWPVTAMLVGFYHVYRWWQLRTHQPVIDMLLILAIALPIAFLQGGVLTDTFFCNAQELSAYEGRSVTTVHFPAGPGYFVWHPVNDWIRLAAPENWPRFLADWGVIVLVYPFLLYHYFYKRREVLASCLLLATS
ncbi:MAG: hypothetical protein K8I82_06195, partial [Anaerolineae bacterium]|nr:hypothetical protein [Anaerolineae bacterium]